MINTQNKWKTTTLYDTSYIQGETTQREPTQPNEYSIQNHPVRKHDRRETTRIPNPWIYILDELFVKFLLNTLMRKEDLQNLLSYK